MKKGGRAIPARPFRRLGSRGPLRRAEDITKGMFVLMSTLLKNAGESGLASGGESIMEKRMPIVRYPLHNIDGVCMQKDTLECPFDKILIINMREQFIRFPTN